MGKPAFAENFAPRGDRRFAEWWAACLRAGASPSAAAALGACELGDRHPTTAQRDSCPELVLSRRGDLIAPPDAARYMAKQIPGGRFVELEGDDHILWLGDVEALCGEIEHFITGIRPARSEPVRSRRSCSVTSRARRASPESSAMRAGPTCSAVTSHRRPRGYRRKRRIVDRTGDGLMASFPGPVAAVRAAQRLQREATASSASASVPAFTSARFSSGTAPSAGLQLHSAARVMAKASGSEVLVSETVKDVVAGSGLRFEDRGVHELKGIDGTKRLFSVSNG